MIEIEDLSKEFDGKVVLDHLSVSLPKGKIIGLIGPDGAGKTTLIRLMAALMRPTSGRIRMDGFDTVLDAAKIHERFGYMPQRFGLYEDLTVMENLRLYADLKGASDAKFEKLFAFTGLAPFTKRLAGKLSGGMKQKLGLACTLVQTPEGLLLDEPSVGVDPISRLELWKMVEELAGQGITILWSTSNLDEAQKCSRVLLLNEGKLLFEGDPAELTRRMEGRTYTLPYQQRSEFFALLQRPEIVDATISASQLRIVTKEGAHVEGATPIPPRFEDGFIDILGGCPKLVSQLEASPHAGQQGISAQHLVKRFGNFTAVDDVSFDIQGGEVFGLLGPNGAGKTTIFKMLCGLLKPTLGESLVGGESMQKAPSAARSRIGYMAQKFSLYEGFTVLQNLQFFSGVYNLQGDEQKRAIERMVEIFNLQPFLAQNARDLPLGYKQRLALACATMHRPEILFLDEPTSGVDPITRREFWTHIQSLVEKKTTVIITTHFMDEAEFCDQIALIYQGKILQMGPPAELMRKAGVQTMEEAFIGLIEASHAV